MITPCKHDCEYYSSYTKTCDYTLLMYKSRGCPVDECDKYIQRAPGAGPKALRVKPDYYERW